jgi:hypothetical protein
LAPLAGKPPEEGDRIHLPPVSPDLEVKMRACHVS